MCSRPGRVPSASVMNSQSPLSQSLSDGILLLDHQDGDQDQKWSLTDILMPDNSIAQGYRAPAMMEDILRIIYPMMVTRLWRKVPLVNMSPDTVIVSEKFHFPPLSLDMIFTGLELSAPLCVGCQGPIHDQFILRVSPDLSWHAACLKVSGDTA